MNIKQLKLCTNIQPTSLTISGKVIEKFINPQERARKHSLRDIMNAILYINKTGCQWRLLPREFGPWQTVYYYFRK